MNSNTTIVTALYYSSPRSRMGGRGYSWAHYKAPFANLINIGANIVVYTHDELHQSIETFFTENNFKNYKIIHYDLNHHKYSDKIYKLKEKEGLIDQNGLTEERLLLANDRNHHLCLSKIDFLVDTIKNLHFESSRYYWVDGGLFHHGLIPERLGGIERLTKINPANYWPINKNSICTPEFFQKLEKKHPSELVFLGLDSHHGRAPIMDLPSISKSPKKTHIIGGLFGGTPEKVLHLSQIFNEILSNTFDAGYLTLEEEVLSTAYGDYFLDQGYLSFNAWGHDIPEERNYLGVNPGSNSFYKLFL